MAFWVGVAVVTTLALVASWFDHNRTGTKERPKCPNGTLTCPATYAVLGALLAMWSIVYFLSY